MSNYRCAYLLISILFINLNITAQSLLWEVSGKNIKTSYLYGTIHIQDERVFNFDSTVHKAFQKSDALALELLLDDINKEDIEQNMLMKNTTIKDLLSENDFNLLDSVIKEKTGMSALLFNKTKPFFISSQIMQSGLKKDKSEALDMFFLKMAKKSDKKTYGLENLKDQLGAIDKISLKEQAEMLMSSIKNEENDSTGFEDLINAYLSFNIDTMISLSKDTSLPKEFNKFFLLKRNKKMASEIKKIAKKHSVFAAIGAAHLGGEKGVLQYLRKKGLTVKAIKFKFINK